MEQEKTTAWDVSLSTMWAISNFSSLSEFCRAANELGMARIELNHQVNSKMLSKIDLRQYEISSIHEPCPADPSMEVLKAQDWLISAEDEDKRQQGIQAVKRSIDLASSLGVRAIVVHPGSVRTSWLHEKELVALFKEGENNTPEYQELKDRLVEERSALAGPRLAAVKKSLVELLAYAAPTGVCFGLENRYHYMEIPSPDELGELLSLGEPGRIGFWYDVGHAHVLDSLGFYPHKEWLDRYAKRIAGVHLHDAVGIDDHQAPGLGQVNYDWIAGCLPAGIIRTLEIKPSATSEQIKDSLIWLEEKACIFRRY